MGSLDSDRDEKKDKKFLSMGEDEQWEAFPRHYLSPRTWWRKWLKMK